MGVTVAEAILHRRRKKNIALVTTATYRSLNPRNVAANSSMMSASRKMEMTDYRTVGTLKRSSGPYTTRACLLCHDRC